jgi:hypothetical protein
MSPVLPQAHPAGDRGLEPLVVGGAADRLGGV